LNPRPLYYFLRLFLHPSRQEVKVLGKTNNLQIAESKIGDLKSEIKKLLKFGPCLRVKEGAKKGAEKTLTQLERALRI